MKPSTLTLVILQLLVFAGLAVFQPLLEPLNCRIRRLVERNRNPRLQTLMMLSHRYNNLMPLSVQLLLLVMMIGLFWQDWMRAVILTAAMVFQVAVVFIIKKLTSVRRPTQAFSKITVNSGSYPSGHSSISMTFALMIPTVLIPHVPVMLVVAVAAYLAFVAVVTAYGRLFLDVHWLTDIIGGWMLSGVTYLLCRGFIV